MMSFDTTDPGALWNAHVNFRRSVFDIDADAADRLIADGPPEMFRPTGQAAMIIDTDIGGDPDDAVAVAVAARQCPELALIITTDERKGDRARFARRFVDALERPDVAVVAGADLGNDRYFVVQDLLPPDPPAVTTDVVTSAAAVSAHTEGPVRWVGIGPASNLHRVLRERRELTTRWRVTQMGGAFQYRDPSRAEHNFRLDPDAARGIVERAAALQLVLSDVTFTPRLSIDRDSSTFARLRAQTERPWAKLLVQHLELWFDRFYASSLQHDALTLSAALENTFVSMTAARVSLDPIGRMRRDEKGHPVVVSEAADYDRFMHWLTQSLTVP